MNRTCKYLLPVALLLALAAPLHAQDGEPIVFPVLQPVAVPVPPTLPPGTIPTVTPGRLYVVHSASPFKLFHWPSASATVFRAKGPTPLGGVFADGTGKFELRTIDAEFIAVLVIEEGATGQVDIKADPEGGTEADAIDRTLRVGGAPIPPGGDDPDEPDPPPTTDLEAAARQWLATVPAECRGNLEDIRETLEDIGGEKGQMAGSAAAMNQLLSIGLAQHVTAKGWRDFFTRFDAAIDVLVAQGVSAEQFGAALVSMARGLE